MSSQKLTQYLPLAVLATVVLFFFPSFRDLFAAWTVWDQSMSHGIPLALMFVYFLWKSAPWPNVENFPFERFFVVPMLMLCVLLWILFYVVKIKIFHQLLLMPIFIAALAMMLGLRAVWNYRILLTLPIYLIPVWDFINDYLVSLSSAVVAEMVRAIKLPALINGNNIQIPSGHIVIADGCSGLRYLIISLCLAHTISYMNGYKERGLLVFLLVAALLGLIANWLRIFLLICIGYSSEMQSSLMEDHETFGWVLFAIMCFIAIYFSPVVKVKKVDGNDLKQFGSPHVIKNFILMLVVLLLAPLMIFGLNTIPINPQKSYLVDAEHYSSSTHPMPLEVTVPKSDVQYNFESIKSDIFVQINDYIPQSMSEQLVPYISRTYNIEAWVQVVSKTVFIGNKPARLQILTDRATEKTVMQIQWFVVGDYHVTSVNQAKIYQVPALLKRKMHFSIFTLQSECETHNCENKELELINESSKLKSE